jgi:hypothetical protein
VVCLVWVELRYLVRRYGRRRSAVAPTLLASAVSVCFCLCAPACEGHILLSPCHVPPARPRAAAKKKQWKNICIVLKTNKRKRPLSQSPFSLVLRNRVKKEREIPCRPRGGEKKDAQGHGLIRDRDIDGNRAWRRRHDDLGRRGMARTLRPPPGRRATHSTLGCRLSIGRRVCRSEGAVGDRC